MISPRQSGLHQGGISSEIHARPARSPPSPLNGERAGVRGGNAQRVRIHPQFVSGFMVRFHGYRIY
jgi:hypothetical protein